LVSNRKNATLRFGKQQEKTVIMHLTKLRATFPATIKFVIKPRNGLVGKFKGHSVDGWWIQDEA
jgi:hypothetical protein